LRFGFINGVLSKSTIPARHRSVRLAATCAAAAMTLGLMGGCDGLTPRSLDPNKGWLDPSEVTFARRGPLRVPILNQLSPGIEEPNEVYANATEPRPEDNIPPQGDYPIGRSDLLQISISDLVGQGLETQKVARVTESGNISLPLIGQVHAEGLTEAQLEQAIREAYRDANIIQNAQVSVTMAEAQSRAFSILGSVGAAGKFPIVRNDFRLMDALVQAHGVSTQGVDYLYVIRPTEQPAAPGTAPATGGTTPGATTPGGTTPGGTTAQPPGGTRTQPPAGQTPGDILAPRPQQPPSQPQRPAPTPPSMSMMIVQDEPGTAGATTQPSGAAGAGATTSTIGAADQPREGRMIIGPDGRPMFVGADPASTNPSLTPGAGTAAHGAGTMTTPGTGTAGAGTMGSGTMGVASSTQPSGFAFNELTEAGGQRVIRVPYTSLRNGELKYNIIIRPNDLIYVPDPVIGEYYMGGHVARPGVFSLTARKITLKQAIISAGMLDQLAIPGRTQVIRRLQGDREVFARVDLEKIFAGLEPDIYLKPDDQVLVGTNAVAPFLAALRGAFRMTYGFGFLYDRNYAPAQRNSGF